MIISDSFSFSLQNSVRILYVFLFVFLFKFVQSKHVNTSYPLLKPLYCVLYYYNEFKEEYF